MTLTPLDIAAGVPLPRAVTAAAPAPGSAVAATPLEALRDVVRDALLRPPCLVSFSGGLDSSVILAVAMDLARREGLPAPVPITWRFHDAPLAYESDWQERVVAELGVRDWVRLTATDVLDYTGPTAMRILARHGLMWPPNAFLHAPLIEHAPGGSLLTGLGGDQLSVLWHPRWRALAAARARRRRARPRDGIRLLAAQAPPSALALWERRAASQAPPWLTASAAGRVESALRDERAGNPVRFDDFLAWLPRRRELAMQRASLARLGIDPEVKVASPLLDERFLAALARAGGRDGFGRRSELFRGVLGGLWPAALDERRTKATFSGAFWRAGSRGVARGWDGAGIDRALVNPAALRRAWLQAAPDFRSVLGLQQVALAALNGKSDT
jgi:hypothetical protein